MVDCGRWNQHLWWCTNTLWYGVPVRIPVGVVHGVCVVVGSACCMWEMPSHKWSWFVSETLLTIRDYYIFRSWFKSFTGVGAGQREPTNRTPPHSYRDRYVITLDKVTTTTLHRIRRQSSFDAGRSCCCRHRKKQKRDLWIAIRNNGVSTENDTSCDRSKS